MTPTGIEPATCRFVATRPPRAPDIPVELRNKHLLDISPEKYLIQLLVFRRVRKIVKNYYDFCLICLLSVRPSIHIFTWNNSVTTERIFMKFDIWVFFEICREIQVSLKRDTENAYFTRRPTSIYDI